MLRFNPAVRHGRISLTVVATISVAVGVFLLIRQGSETTPASMVVGAKPVSMPAAATAVRLMLAQSPGDSGGWNGEISVSPGQVNLIVDEATGRRFDNNDWSLDEDRLFGSADSLDSRIDTRRSGNDIATDRQYSVLALLSAPADAKVEISTNRGDFAFAMRDLSYSATHSFLGGAVSAVRAVNSVQLTDTSAHEDFPAAVVDSDGRVWCAYVAYEVGTPIDRRSTDQGQYESLVARANGDQIRLFSYDGDLWSAPINVTDGQLDVWRPTVATTAEGIVWIFWAQQVEQNWDLYGRAYNPQASTFGPIHRLTDGSEADINVVSAGRQGSDEIWVAWQSKRDGNFDILAAELVDGDLQNEKRISTSSANDWNATCGFAGDGSLWFAWDTYEKGDYDIYARQMRNGELSEPVAIADSTRYEGRPNLVVDKQNRIWIAFEDADSNWGKDHGPRLTGQGVPFYEERNIIVRCITEEGLQQTFTEPRSQQVATAFDDKRYKPVKKHRISFPRLALDGNSNLWLLYRRHPEPTTANGERWVGFARHYNGDTWSEEILLPNSLNLLDNRPALVPLKSGGLLSIYSSDGRTTNARSAQVAYLNATQLEADSGVNAAVLIPADSRGNRHQESSIDPNERENVARCRDYRIEVGGQSLRLLRGEFHRHTEISSHRDWDGPLEEVWRYGLDVADMDWIGPGDHDYGVGHDYMWWLTQKQIDLYHDAPRFVTMFTYERSKSYPSGHRNVMFPERGIRPLPALTSRELLNGTPEEGSADIKNLYGYLKFFGGICSSHTSATNMGTDWRDNDPTVEPVVEIFQGHRQNYEETNAPLAARNAADTIQGYRPAGFVWEAFGKGLRLGFQASSDHVSTHTSYGFVLAEDSTREGIIEAFRKRHSYAANDNIVLDVRCGDQIMGDEFNLTRNPQIDVKVFGTAPIARIDIIRQIEGQMPEYVYNRTPGEPQDEFQWTDANSVAGKVNMYYVRVQQIDARMAWASPMWIHVNPN